MDYVSSYFTVAIYLVLAVGLLIALCRRYRSVTSESRIQRMMLSCGIDEMAALNADHLLKLDMDQVRQRCRNCPVTDECDRFLAGECVAGHGFCPNAWYFERAAASRIRATQRLDLLT